MQLLEIPGDTRRYTTSGDTRRYQEIYNFRRYQEITGDIKVHKNTRNPGEPMANFSMKTLVQKFTRIQETYKRKNSFYYY